MNANVEDAQTPNPGIDTVAEQNKSGIDTAECAAQIFLLWAQENRLIGEEIPLSVHINDDDEKDDLFDRLKVTAAAERILRHRQIKFVAFNEEAKSVLVYTLRKVTIAETKLLPYLLGFDTAIRMEFHHCGAIQAGTPDNTSSSPYYKLNELYCCGSSIHPARHIGAGTMGCLVKDEDGTIYGLTNNHVSGMCNFSTTGEKIIAPGHIDINSAGIDPFTIGYHYKSLPFTSGVPDNIQVSENFDAALFKICDPSKISSFQGEAYDTPTEILDPTAGLTIEKVGRTTGLTKGIILGMTVGPIHVGYTIPEIGNQLAYFENVLVAIGNGNEAFSEPGDSGSLVTAYVNETRYAIGLVFAGVTNSNSPVSFILPIREVLNRFRVTLISNHNI